MGIRDEMQSLKLDSLWIYTNIIKYLDGELDIKSLLNYESFGKILHYQSTYSRFHREIFNPIIKKCQKRDRLRKSKLSKLIWEK